MTMKKVGDISAKVGSYKAKTGEEKNRYIKCGALFCDDKTHRYSIKLDAFPASPEWSGWLNVFENASGERDGGQPPKKFDDDLPF